MQSPEQISLHGNIFQVAYQRYHRTLCERAEIACIQFLSEGTQLTRKPKCSVGCQMLRGDFHYDHVLLHVLHLIYDSNHYPSHFQPLTFDQQVACSHHALKLLWNKGTRQWFHHYNLPDLSQLLNEALHIPCELSQLLNGIGLPKYHQSRAWCTHFQKFSHQLFEIHSNSADNDLRKKSACQVEDLKGLLEVLHPHQQDMRFQVTSGMLQIKQTVQQVWPSLTLRRICLLEQSRKKMEPLSYMT